MSEKCTWTYSGDDFDYWETTCGQTFVLTDGGPLYNEMKFCCYCGKSLIEDWGLIENEDEEDD